MNEVEKMRSSQLADMSVPEIQVKFEHAKRLLAKMRVMSTYDEDYRSLLEELVPGIPATSVICPPFHCDHGDGIRLGEHVFVNANCTFLDGGYITIGAHTLVGPGYDAQHHITGQGVPPLTPFNGPFWPVDFGKLEVKDLRIPAHQLVRLFQWAKMTN